MRDSFFDLKDEQVLFRSVTPLEFCYGMDIVNPLVVAEGIHNGETYKVYFLSSNTLDEAKSRIFQYWTYSEIGSIKNITDHISMIGGLYNRFLVIDNIVDVSDYPNLKKSKNTSLAVHVYESAIKSLMLHHNASGPYVEVSWQLRFPVYFGMGVSVPLVSMNQFFCKNNMISSVDSFGVILKVLLSMRHEESDFSRRIEFSLELISGSLRTLDVKHSLALLFMAFEALFTKCQNDFSGGSKRLARIVGVNKGDVTRIWSFLNGNDNRESLRRVRNIVMHGDLIESIDFDRMRIIFSEVLAKGIIFLIRCYGENEVFSNYYHDVERLAESRFFGLDES